MLAPFPRTSIYPSSHPHFQKHNRRLGKVSHQMQKIIDDIQGKVSDSSDTRKLDSKKAVNRKSAEMREQDNIEYVQRRSQRRKLRKCVGSDGEQREIACQTTVLESNESTKYTSSQQNRLKNPMQHKSNSLDRNSRSPDYRKDVKRTKMDNPFDAKYDGQSEPKLERQTDSKVDRVPCRAASLNGNEHQSDCKLAPWQRPLPPVPTSGKQTTDSQAKLYKKVFQTVTSRLGENRALDDINVDKNISKDLKKNHLLFTPVKSLSMQIQERNHPMRLRYVDIDKISSDRKSKTTPISNRNDGFFLDEDEHIYESIDEDDGYETIQNSKARQLFPPNPHSPLFRSRHSDIGIFTPNTPFSPAFRTFRGEDTYLEPVCSLEDIRCKIHRSGSESSDDTACHMADRISDFHDYTRDFAVSPASSTISEESVSIRSTYV